MAGCTGGVEGIHPMRIDDYFPHDGQRRAEYVNADPAVPWTLVVEKLGAEEIGGVRHVTYEWTRADTEATLGSVTWSTGDDGIYVHAWGEGPAAPEPFDPPVALADDDALHIGAVATTQTGGRTFTSTFVGIEDCPVAWGYDWEGCLHFTLDDGDGDPMTGPPFAGDYWLVTRYGPAWMHVSGYAEKWNLSRYQWSGDAP